MITVHINGKPFELDAAVDIQRLLVQRGIDVRVVAVAHNGVVIPRESLATVALTDGDQVEIVRMVGGG